MVNRLCFSNRAPTGNLWKQLEDCILYFRKFHTHILQENQEIIGGNRQTKNSDKTRDCRHYHWSKNKPTKVLDILLTNKSGLFFSHRVIAVYHCKFLSDNFLKNVKQKACEYQMKCLENYKNLLWAVIKADLSHSLYPILLVQFFGMRTAWGSRIEKTSFSHLAGYKIGRNINFCVTGATSAIGAEMARFWQYCAKSSASHCFLPDAAGELDIIF